MISALFFLWLNGKGLPVWYTRTNIRCQRIQNYTYRKVYLFGSKNIVPPLFFRLLLCCLEQGQSFSQLENKTVVRSCTSKKKSPHIKYDNMNKLFIQSKWSFCYIMLFFHEGHLFIGWYCVAVVHTSAMDISLSSPCPDVAVRSTNFCRIIGTASIARIWWINSIRLLISSSA